MAGPIDELYDEHRDIAAALAGASALAQRVREGGDLDRDAAEKMIEFFQVYLDRVHHGKEEHHLFHMMPRHGLPQEGLPVGVLHAEHHQGRAYVQQMVDALPPAATGDAGARRRFARAVFRHAGLLRTHIPKEEQTLFTIAARVLSETEKAALAEVWERVNREEMGEAGRERYRALIGEFAGDE